MAFTSGTATNYLNVMEILRDFLKTNGTLVGLGQNWTQLAGPTGVLADGDEFVMQGPGLSASDEIIVGFHMYAIPLADNFFHTMTGLVSFNPSLDVASQVNRGNTHSIASWNDPLPYWIVANGRRFVMVTRTSTVYHHYYGGFLLPYCDPSSWPYPLFVGGTNNQNYRWSENDTYKHSAYFDGATGSADLCYPDTTWQPTQNYTSSNTPISSDLSYVYPWRGGSTFWRDNIDGTYTLEPAEVMCTDRFQGNLGILEGVFKVPGFGNASENVITISGTDYIVFQNLFRTSNEDFMALRMA